MSTQTQKFLGAVIGAFQAVEDAFQQLRFERTVDAAIGVQLDALGKLVGRLRNGVTDDEVYRRYIRAQIVTNKSDGLIEDVISIADLVIYDDDAYYHVVNWGNGSITVRVEDVITAHALATQLISFLRRGVAGGVRILLEFFPVAEADSFAFDGGDDGLGWGSTLDAGVGGGFASVIE